LDDVNVQGQLLPRTLVSWNWYVLLGGAISLKKDAQGRDILVPTYDYVPGFNTQPKRFPFCLKEWSEMKEKIVAEAWKENKANGPDMLT
jgi:hypothetical protein